MSRYILQSPMLMGGCDSQRDRNSFDGVSQVILHPTLALILDSLPHVSHAEFASLNDHFYHPLLVEQRSTGNSTNGATFDWKGSGMLFFVHSHWEILGYGKDEASHLEWAVTCKP